MSYFKRIALVKSHQKFEPVDPAYTTDITELCHLGAFIEKDVEHISIPISPYNRDPIKAFRKSLKSGEYDLVGISAMTPGYNNAREYARIAKEAGTYVIMGGYHPTALPDQVLADPNVDAVVRGEGELPLRDLVLHGPSGNISGLSFKENGGSVQHNPPAALIEELDQLPMALRDIRPDRFGERGNAYSVDTIYSSRGCIAKCTFCANDTMNQKFRPRSPENFVDELEQLHDKRVKKLIKFFDSIFMFDPDRVEKILELMFRRNLTNFRIFTETRTDDVIRCRHLMKDLKRIGFEKILIGIESPNIETYKKLRKGGSLKKHEQAIQILQEANIRMDAFLIIGHPHETEQDIRQYPEFAKRVKLDHQAVYFVMTPYPGTQIFQDYEKRKLIESFDWDNYNNFGAVVRLEKLERSTLRNLLSHCHGSTGGFSYWFQKQPGIIGVIVQLFYMTVFWLYFYDCQGEDTREEKNEFIWSFFRASYGHYHKKRKPNRLGKVFQRFFKTFQLRFEIGGITDSFVIAFRAQGDDFWMDVQPYVQTADRMLTVTLDDMSEIQRTLSMSDANGLMFLCEDGGGPFKRFRRCLTCYPIFWVLAKAFFKCVGNIGVRYLNAASDPSPVHTGNPTNCNLAPPDTRGKRI